MYVGIKMADYTVYDDKCSTSIPKFVTERSEISCMCCDELKLELERTLLELKSALEIIKILQEGDSAKWTEHDGDSIEGSKLNQNDSIVQNREMEGEWTVVEPYRHWNSRKPVRKRPQVTIKNVNKYEVLQNIDEEASASQSTQLATNRGTAAKKRKSSQRKKRKIVVVGDSFARGIAGELLHNLGKAFEVIGYVNSGSGMEVITNVAKRESTTLTKKDMVVIWGGTNDIAKNEVNSGLMHIMNFVKLRENTNVLLVDAPTRFDLSPVSCVNREVLAFNRKLLKRIKLLEHVKIIDSELQRIYFTEHGMHMTKAGKGIMAQRIAEQIKETFSKRDTHTITLQWKQDMDNSTELTGKDDIVTNVDEAVVNIQGNLSLLMGNDSENSNDNSGNTKDTSSKMQDMDSSIELIGKDDIETNVDEVVVNMQGNLSLLMGNDNVNANDNSGNTKDTSTIKCETECSEKKGSLPKRDRKCFKAKSEDFLWF